MTGYTSPPAPSVPASGPQGYGPRGASADRLLAVLSYVLAPVAGFVAPLVIYLVNINASGYVRYHSAQSLNLGITGVAYAIGAFMAGLVLGVLTRGPGFAVIVPLLGAIGAGVVLFAILAAIAASRGKLYRVPVFACLPIVH